jgi:hypothetical protein
VDLDTVADKLYALPLEEFSAARDDAAKRADDPALKKAIKALRKPTVSAHAVNALVRAQPSGVDDLLALGDELRAAMAGGGGDVRRLTEQRREFINGLVDAGLPANVQADVTATLEAATADPDLGAAVRSGRLVKPLRYAGFGTLPDLADVVATPPSKRAAPRTATAKPPTKTSAPPKKSPPLKKSAPSEPDLTAMRERVLELAGAADDAQRRYDDASRAAVEARKLLDRAEAERAEAHKAARAAHAEAEKARRELGRLERR